MRSDAAMRLDLAAIAQARLAQQLADVSRRRRACACSGAIAATTGGIGRSPRGLEVRAGLRHRIAGPLYQIAADSATIADER